MWIRGESLNRIQKGRVNESDRSRLPCFVFSIMPFTCSLLSDRLNRNTRSREEKKKGRKKRSPEALAALDQTSHGILLHLRCGNIV